MNTLYLNNSGSRWIQLDKNGRKPKFQVYFPKENKHRSYTLCYFEAVGNFAHAIIKYKGKRECLMHYKDGIYLINNEENRNFRFGKRYEYQINLNNH
jgi:calcineurin-like phosphoesterase family protein